MTITFDRYFDVRKVIVESFGHKLVLGQNGLMAVYDAVTNGPVVVEQRHIDIVNRFKDQINGWLDGEWNA